VLPISAGLSLHTLNTTLPSDTYPEEVTPSRLLKVSTIPKTPRKYLISKKEPFVPTEKANNTEEKRKNPKENQVKKQTKI
jgi:hypothetical protein